MEILFVLRILVTLIASRVGDGLQGQEAEGVSPGAEAGDEEQGCVPGVLLQV